MATAAAAAAAAAALYNSVPQNHFLYSQWLAARNTSALFGLQGECLDYLTYRVTHLVSNYG